MTLTLGYYICIFVCASSLIFMQWWEMRTNKRATLTLKELLVGIFLSVCPIINAIVAFCMWGFIFTDICKDIVIFGPRK